MNYKNIYDRLIEKAKSRISPEGYIERHHIIPRCLGGTDSNENIVVLTPEEHYVAHQLLVKLYPDHSGLVYAANKMCIGHDKHGRKNNKRYSWLKRKYSEHRKNDSKGEGNNQYGTIWINKIGTMENKKIKKNDKIPEGWRKGRIIKTKKCISCNEKLNISFSSKTKYCDYCRNKKRKNSSKSNWLKNTDLELLNKLYKRHKKGESLNKLSEEYNKSTRAFYYDIKKLSVI